jgi:hypothetical protein
MARASVVELPPRLFVSSCLGSSVEARSTRLEAELGGGLPPAVETTTAGISTHGELDDDGGDLASASLELESGR